MKYFASSLLSFLRAFPLEILLMFVLLFIDFFPNSIWFWFPVIFVLTFSANYLRTKGWWGTALYILAFLTWVPAVFYHYGDAEIYYATHHDWTSIMANLMALGLFLLVGDRTDSREWAGRALHRFAALFQAILCFFIFFLILLSIDERIHFNRRLSNCLSACNLIIPGLLLCWRLWTKPKTSKWREAFLKGMEWMLSVVNIFLVAMAFVASVFTIIKGTLIANNQGYLLFAVYLLLGVGMLMSDARGDKMPAWMMWFYRYLPLIALPMLALLWYSTLIPISWFGWSEGRIFLLLMAGMITIFQFMALIRRPLSLRVSIFAVILALAVFVFVPSLRMDEMALRSQKSRYNAALRILKDKGVRPEDAPNYDALYADSELADALLQVRSAIVYFESHLPYDSYDDYCGQNKKWLKYDQDQLISIRAKGHR